MRFVTSLLVASVLALPAIAPAHAAKPVHKMMAKSHHVARTGTPGHPTPDDQGPFTPEANRAYNGGGLVTETPPK